MQVFTGVLSEKEKGTHVKTCAAVNTHLLLHSSQFEAKSAEASSKLLSVKVSISVRIFFYEDLANNLPIL